MNTTTKLFLVLVMNALSAFSQQTLTTYFQQMLSASPETSAPRFDDVFRYTRSIPGMPRKEIEAALPTIIQALKRDDHDLAINSCFTLYVISHRPDAPSLLRPYISDIQSLLIRSNERLRAGGISLLHDLTPTLHEETIPIMRNFLDNSQSSSLVRVDVASTLLEFQKSDPEVIESVSKFMYSGLPAPAKIAMIKSVSAHRFLTPESNKWLLQALSDRDRYVKIAAIHAVDEMKGEVLSSAQRALMQLTIQKDESPDVKHLAQQTLDGTLSLSERSK